MDHKVSKDMISSGMIPSGEKTQADLGRIQYGSAPSPNSLFDAYKSMYEHHQKDKDGNTIPHEGEELNEGKIPAGLQAYLDKKKGKKEDKKDVKEMAGMPSVDKMKGQIADRKKEVASEKDARREKIKGIMNKMGESADLFDIVSTYFIEEGYDKKDVYAVMSSVDLSEEVQDIHEVIPLIGAALAGAGKLAAGIGAKVAAGKALAAKGLAAAGKVGATAGKVGSGAAKVTKSGGAIVQGGGPTNMLGKAKKLVKDNPMTSYMVARDITSGGGAPQPMTRKTSSISASADLFDIVKGQLLDEGLSEKEIRDIMLTLTPDEIMSEMNAGPSTPVKNYGDSPDKPKILPNFGATRAKPRTTDRGTLIKGGKDTGKTPAQMSQEEYKGSGTPEQQAAMKAQVEVSKKVNRYGGKTPSGTTAVDAKKGIEDVRKSM
jgi:hypothetical protein